MTNPLFSRLLLCVSPMLLVGCSSQFQRYSLDGTVTLDGQSLTDCVIVFVPIEAGASGASGVVRNGQFSIDKKAGATEGQFHLLFSEVQPELEEFERRRSSDLPPLKPNVLPRKYHKPSDIAVTVGPGHSHHFEIKLTSN